MANQTINKVQIDGNPETYDVEDTQARQNILDLTQKTSQLKEDLDNLSEIVYGDNLLKPKSESGYIQLSDGQPKNNSSYHRSTEPTKIPNGKTSLNFIAKNTFNDVSVLFYSDNRYDSFISFVGIPKGLSKSTINIPTNALYFRISASVSDNFEDICVNADDVIYVPYTEKIVIKREAINDNTLDKSKFTAEVNETLEGSDILIGGVLLKGKTIVNFGDSIFGNTQDDTSLSAKIAIKTGATVINLGFGGTRMTDSRGTKGDWSCFDLPNVIKSIIDNDYTDMDNALSVGLPGGNPGYFLGTVRDLKVTDFNNVDIVTINNGTNDYTSGITFDNDDNKYDTSYYKGAIRYIVRELLTNYPHLKIVFISPSWRYWKNEDGSFLYDSTEHYIGGNKESHNLLDYLNAMEDMTLELNIPTIDTYHVGFNEYNCSRYYPSDDSTHQNEYGREVLADHISRQLMSM